MGADAKAVLAIDLETGKAVSGGEALAKTLGGLKDKINADKKELAELQSQMKNMQAGTSVNAAEFKKLKDGIDSKKSSIQKSQEEYTKLGGKLTELGKKSKDTGGHVVPLNAKISELGSTMGGMPGPVGAAGGSLSSFASLLANPYVAVAALIVVLAAGVVAIAAFAFKLADAARSARLFLNAIAGSEAGGARLSGQINRLSKDLPITKQALTDISKSLTDKGLQGAPLEHALSAIARTTSVLGATAGGKLEAIAEQSKKMKRFYAQALDFTGTGVSINDVAEALAKRTKTTMANAKAAIQTGAVDLATGLQALDDATKNKLGDSAKKMNLSLSSIGERAKQNFAGIFSGLKIDKVLEMVSGLVAIFDESTESGKALRAIAETMLQPLFDSVGKGGPLMSRFIKALVIHALGLAIMFFQARNAVKAFAEDPLGAIADLSAELVGLGASIVDGIVSGIKGGASKVAAAVKGAVSGAIDKAKGVLDSHSPSRVFMRIGLDTMRGLALGIDEGADEPRQGMSGVIGDTVGAARDAAGGGAANDNRRNVVNHNEFNFIINGGNPAEVKRSVWDALEEVGIMSGALAPEPA